MLNTPSIQATKSMRAIFFLGLVGQQIDSFDEFIRYTIQELVYDTGEITMTPEDQFIIGQDVAQVRIT